MSILRETGNVGMLPYQATVQSVDQVSGRCQVRIPALLGRQIITIEPTGLTKQAVGGAWLVPAIGSTVTVMATPDLSQFSWAVSGQRTDLSSINQDIAIIEAELGIFEDSQDPMGLDGSSTLSVATRTVTITPAPSLDVWIHSYRYTFTAPQSVTVPNATALYFVYFDASGTLVQSTTPWDLSQVAPVATFYWHATDAKGLLGDERHRVVMDWATHERLHTVDGAQMTQGGVISGYTVAPAAPANTDNTYALASGVLHDEDLIHSVTAVADNGPYFLAWREGATAWRWTTNDTVPLLYTVAGYINYNQFTGGAWQRTQLGSGQYMNFYVLATNVIDPANCKYVIVPGQSVYSTQSAAQAESVLTLDLSGFGSQEFAAVWQLTMRTSNGYSSTGKCRIEVAPVRLVGTRLSVTSSLTPTSHTALSNRTDTDSHPATAISYVPSTIGGSVGINDVNVQTAIDHIISQLVPAGTIWATCAAAADPGWFLLNGQTLTNAQTIFPALWAKVPTTWKSGANIVLPDAQGKFLVMDDSGATFTLGTAGGANSKTIASGNLPTHTHAVGTLVTSNESSHTHSADGTLATAGPSGDSHYHGVSGNTATEGSHRHGQYVTGGAAGGGSLRYDYNGDGNYTAYEQGVWTGAGEAHLHSISLNSAGPSGNSHTHDVTGNTSAGSAHNHPITGATADGGFANTALDITPANLVVNYQIKAH